MTQTLTQNDWNKIEALQTHFGGIAFNWASRTGIDKEELEAEMVLRLAECALKDSGFLTNEDAYILQAAAWRAVDALRPRKFDQEAFLEADLPDGQQVNRVGDGTNLADSFFDEQALLQVLSHLDARGQTLAQAIITAGDDVLKVNGLVNVSALADHLDRPERTVSGWVAALRRNPLFRDGLARAANVAPHTITAIYTDSHGHKRCRNCGRFASRTKQHLCPKTETAIALNRHLSSRLDASPDLQVLSQLLTKARSEGTVELQHPASGEIVDVTLDGLPVALADGFEPITFRQSLSTGTLLESTFVRRPANTLAMVAV